MNRPTLLALALLVSGLAAKSQSPRPEDSTRDERTPARLAEVTVTVRKLAEKAQDIPAAVTVLTARDVEAYRLWKGDQLTAIAPNLYVANPGDGRNVISARGIVSTSYDPAVTTYIDGVSQFTLDTYIPQLFDVQSIEVLKGPQGTLYGRNAMGGIVNIVTKRPTDHSDGFAEASAGNYGLQRYTAGFRTPVVKGKLYAGIAGLYEGSNGFYTNDFDGSHFDKQHRTGGNAYLRYLPGAHWDLTLNAKLLFNRDRGAFPLTASPEDALAKPFHLDQNAVGWMVDNTWNLSFSAKHTGRVAEFSSQTTAQSNYRIYRKPVDGDFSPIDGVTIYQYPGPHWSHARAFTEEFRFATPAASSSNLRWVAGLYGFYQNAPTKLATHFGRDAALVGSPDTNYSIINTSTIDNYGAAAYGQLTWRLTTRVDLSAGLRYDYQHSREEVHGQYQPDGSPEPAFDTQPDTAGTANYGAVSPMISLAARLSPASNLYLTWNRGYRTGGLTQLSSDPSQPPLYAYKPEYSNNFEAGMKNFFFDRRLMANAAVFYILVDHAQVPTLILPEAITVTRNAGRLKSYGFDAELRAILVKGLEAGYSIGYTHARYSSLHVSSNGASADYSGNHQIFTPDLTSMLSLQYGLSVNRVGTARVFLRGEWQYLGRQYFDLANSISQGSYSVLNASAGLTLPRLYVTVWTRNLANAKYIAYAYDFGAAHLGDPATYGATVGIRL